jgi:GrpB-like predicted nucleotidyltransferase (UPF0157 family)
MISSLGLEPGTVRVVSYDRAWPDLYSVEAARVIDVLAQNDVTLVLEHTGSTAVPGLAAKPIVDMLAGRALDQPREPLIEALQSAGYTYRGEQGIPGRDFFRRGNPRQYHLHLTQVESSFWLDHLNFRDYLRSHPEVAARYATLKLELASLHQYDREAYIDGKTEFVNSVLAIARQRQ